ncbi:sodium-dependent transporter [Pseudactinotalea suaedae]|uniref:sodium-dependent transporter n=1 Tax=Pseudactinotalea suaedae TaxID=1524924 RepID=UPI0012E1EAFF|nr:sodium-dependent transporter [Pseudactinotalea suaedae]
MSATTDAEKRRGAFSSRTVFILAAIGSAVGLGNIWRFPYVAYEGGGGAFMVPYIVALLVAGLPFLLMDYALGHRFRGSAPLTFARLRRWTEGIGWWQVAICVAIAVYYAAVIAWSIRYTGFSLTQAWGDDPESFLMNDFLQRSSGISFDIVPGVLVPLTLVWVVTIAIMTLGVQRGVGATAVVFIPVLLVAFTALVVQALLLPGAATGLDALFTPQWAALLEPGVWGAAFGQIFFSLSVGFGIMITYSSYVGRKTDMPGSGLVVGLSNSGFELLAGIGVFAALGFLAQANGVQVTEVVASGIGLAFVVFPTIISEAPAGALIGVLFFGSLVLAGITSLVSILEVVISAVRDKFELTRVRATLVVTVPAALVSIAFFSTASGLSVLDIVDHFVNQYGILLVAVVSTLAVAWGVRALPELAAHLNRSGSIRLGRWWYVLVGGVIPVALTFVLVQQLITDLRTPYEGYPTWMLAVFGWGVAVAAIIFGLIAGRTRWRADTAVENFETEQDLEDAP